uniref:Anoctamin n=1 Tax=Meloidogyne floridensis TaxID=298350 RepID=A0A915NM48_9BILA
MRKIIKWADDLPESVEPSNETVLAILSKKMTRDDAESLAKMLTYYCPSLYVDIRQQNKRRRYALAFSLKNDTCLKDSTERLVKIRRLLEQAQTDKEEQIQFIFDNHPFILNIPTGTFLIPFLLSKSTKIIYSLIPLHQPDHLSQLFLNWVFSSPSELLHPPIQQISGYFGLEISLYFAWLAHYTKCLIAPALIGTLIYLQTSSTTTKNFEFFAFIIFAIFNCLWAIGFLYSWKIQKQHLIQNKEPLNHQNNFKFRQNLLKNICRPIEIFSLISLWITLIILLRLQDWSRENFGSSNWKSLAPVVLQALICMGAEYIYRRCAEIEWIRGKRKNDFLLSLATLLVTRQFVQNFTEIGIPLIYGELRLMQYAFIRNLEAKRKVSHWRAHQLANNFEEENPSEEERQAALSEYGRPLDDYLEMFIQLGYVLLFSPAFPLAPLCAFLNNLLEARVDAFKLCALHRRPWPTDDVGGWDGVIKIMLIASVWVNLGLILLRCLTIG